MIFGLCLFALAYFATFGIRTTRIGKLQRLISENLQPGDSPDQVAHFLDAQHLDHSQIINQEMITISGHGYGNQNVLIAIKRNTWRSLIQTESMQLVFVFDAHDKLLRADVLTVYTGL